jgi:predicted signal transduction protein with EAL and GGDEF domain
VKLRKRTRPRAICGVVPRPGPVSSWSTTASAFRRDELLIEAGRRIVATVRGCDTVARLGGDEFAILISDIDGPAVAEELARRVLVALGEPFWVAGRGSVPVGQRSASPPGIRVTRTAPSAARRGRRDVPRQGQRP